MRCDLSYIKSTLRPSFETQLSTHALQGQPSVGRFRGGIVLPCARASLTEYRFNGGVVAADGTFVESSALHEQPCAVGGAYHAEPEKCGYGVIYIGFLLFMWGHQLTDSLKKLWFLHTPEGKAMLERGGKVEYVSMDIAPFPEREREIWRLAGYDCSGWLHITTPTKFAEVVVPGNSFVAKPDETRLYFPLFVAEITRIKESAKAEAIRRGEDRLPAPKRIYLTRTRLNDGKDFNERQVERLFERRGFTVVAPERLLVSRQIWLMMNCGTLAATEGCLPSTADFFRRIIWHIRISALRFTARAARVKRLSYRAFSISRATGATGV